MRDTQTYQIRTLLGYWKVILCALSVVFSVEAACCILNPTCDWLYTIELMLLIYGACFFFAWICTKPRYQIEADKVHYLFFGVRYRTILCSEYPRIIVTNATFHVKASGFLAGDMPIIDSQKTRALGYTVSFPYFIAVTQDYPIEKVRPGMNAATVYHMDWNHAMPIGLCYPSAFKSFRKNTDVDFLVQTDVIEHYPELFSDYHVETVAGTQRTWNTVCK